MWSSFRRHGKEAFSRSIRNNNKSQGNHAVSGDIDVSERNENINGNGNNDSNGFYDSYDHRVGDGINNFTKNLIQAHKITGRDGSNFYDLKKKDLNTFSENISMRPLMIKNGSGINANSQTHNQWGLQALG